ncbi:MAG: SMC-Scp complex subunit ScpB [Clostridiales bacterium]|nr:SMC-Scp complex subunit ScpB [Clostridiales bacterium]
MKNLEKLTNIIEAIVFVSGNPIEIKDIAEKLEITEDFVLLAVKDLQEKYNKSSGIQLLMFNKKLQFASNSDYADDVSAVLNPIKERELSKSMLEVAAIIAYKQPVTRMDLEEIRGNSEYALQKLLELKVIEPVGRKDAVGKPVLFGTTDEFLKRFQISSLDELPDYETLLEQVALIRGENTPGDYLYRKDVYVDENTPAEPLAEAVATTTETEDFDLPSIEEEEIPDFLKDEEVDKI